jgi:hypothetical protein
MSEQRPEETFVVGIGGIGWIVSFMLGFSFNFSTVPHRVNLVDGGIYKPDHADHEFFLKLNNKARAQQEHLARLFSNVAFRSVPYYLSEARGEKVLPVHGVVSDNAVVFLCVDNHKSRKLLSDHCESLHNATLISGSNDGGSLGFVQVHIRRNDRDITPPISFQHPDIESPDDYSPEDRLRTPGCDERLRSGKQLPSTLFCVAAMMHAAFFTIRDLEKQGNLDDFPYREVFFCCATGKARPITKDPGKTWREVRTMNE